MTNIVEKAKDIAKNHLIKTRYEHAKRVVKLLSTYYSPSEVEIAASYLHDIFEDTYLSEKYIIDEVGQEVCDLVKELTNPTEYYGDAKSFDHMKNASELAKRIKLCDRTDNILKRIKNIEEYRKKVPQYINDSMDLLEIIGSSDKKLAEVYKNTLVSLKNMVS